jgi:hypothetical protein
MSEHVALVPEQSDISPKEVMRVAAALQKQVVRDFQPLWGVSATVDAFGSLDDVPLDYWPIIVVDDVPNGAGVHLDQDGKPYALVERGSTWSLTASHECLEMLADPFGNRMRAGASPKAGQGRVEFLVEVCDPSESDEFAYTVNGILVSDFYTPDYFDPKPTAGVRYSYTGALTAPRQVLRGGYLSWHEPVSDAWWQLAYFGAKPTFRNLGTLRRVAQSWREMIDARTPRSKALSHLRSGTPGMLLTASGQATCDQSAEARATSLRRTVKSMMRKAAPSMPKMT